MPTNVTAKLSELPELQSSQTTLVSIFVDDVSGGQAVSGKGSLSGKLATNRLVIRNLVGTRFTAQVELEEGKATLSDVRGEVMAESQSRGLASIVTRPNPPHTLAPEPWENVGSAKSRRYAR